ncbi:serine/threonine protein kinase [Streptomyces venezuelae]|uniref:non-specific serine/threonine protein kinase n=1 Tax=Streptomyces venezuelae TaxID=54571 RepID=A0A5P2DCP1_STRVZ|nr:serine/threonine-protein kinase [Streptomyces venezuelae]QES50859.1 serine/threonine protein kinase [Streptomyces venezuelae]
MIAGRYRLLDPLGEGATGIVWRARDEVLGREVAVKEVRAPAGTAPAAARELYDRVAREAGAAARITHRGVVRVHDVATEEGRPWIVMELVRGLSLAEVLAADGPLPPQRVAHLGEQLLVALRSAHEAGVLHRDVKPANVLLGNDGRVMLSDFGLLQPAGTEPAFLAPERLSGREPGPESDLWSLGALLYAAVAGAAPPPLREGVAGVPAPGGAGPLAPVLEGLLRRDPADRLPVAEAARMLRVVGAGGRVRADGGPVSGPAQTPAGGRTADGTTAGGGSPAPAPPDEAVPRRAGLVLTAGVLVLLAALVALILLIAY